MRGCRPVLVLVAFTGLVGFRCPGAAPERASPSVGGGSSANGAGGAGASGGEDAIASTATSGVGGMPTGTVCDTACAGLPCATECRDDCEARIGLCGADAGQSVIGCYQEFPCDFATSRTCLELACGGDLLNAMCTDICKAVASSMCVPAPPQTVCVSDCRAALSDCEPPVIDEVQLCVSGWMCGMGAPITNCATHACLEGDRPPQDWGQPVR